MKLNVAQKKFLNYILNMESEGLLAADWEIIEGDEGCLDSLMVNGRFVETLDKNQTKEISEMAKEPNWYETTIKVNGKTQPIGYTPTEKMAKTMFRVAVQLNESQSHVEEIAVREIDSLKTISQWTRQ